ncbi:NAC domain protein [Hibiscus syriacus]|uniref:NAC domain protein n=1 Tax=Hibiscus syriacus TaxID=106335 RepID=A0A6A3AF58_HIBSY|nr:uncharacterized protein LOC120127843 [Hibiscus syriacus]KAE8703231.1 NAC domain protein [Hibiscus syriacus]
MTNSALPINILKDHLLINMQLTILERRPTRGLKIPPPAGEAAEENRGGRRSYIASSSSSSGRRPRCTCSGRLGSVPCSRHGYMVPKQNMRRYGGNKEILRRALAPPNRKMTLRWWNFKPTPSRLSNMSMA